VSQGPQFFGLQFEAEQPINGPVEPVEQGRPACAAVNRIRIE
jgi:hypothetical protein